MDFPTNLNTLSISNTKNTDVQTIQTSLFCCSWSILPSQAVCW